MFCYVWKVDTIIYECKMDKNICTDLLEVMVNKLSFKMKPQSPLNTKPRFSRLLTRASYEPAWKSTNRSGLSLFVGPGAWWPWPGLAPRKVSKHTKWDICRYCIFLDKMGDARPKRVVRFVFNKKMLNHRIQKVRTSVLDDFALVDGGFHFHNFEYFNVHVCRRSWMSQMSFKTFDFCPSSLSSVLLLLLLYLRTKLNNNLNTQVLEVTWLLQKPQFSMCPTQSICETKTLFNQAIHFLQPDDLFSSNRCLVLFNQRICESYRFSNQSVCES